MRTVGLGSEKNKGSAKSAEPREKPKSNKKEKVGDRK